jgi:hypothetical protein
MVFTGRGDTMMDDEGDIMKVVAYRRRQDEELFWKALLLFVYTRESI